VIAGVQFATVVIRVLHHFNFEISQSTKESTEDWVWT